MHAPGLRTRAASFGAAALTALLSSLLGAGSCIETDIGAPCMLVKTHPVRGPDASAECVTIIGTDTTVDEDKSRTNPECYHPNREDLRGSFDKDFVSFGATECENLTCVRARCPYPDPNDPGKTDQARCENELLPASDADPNGFCSGECITDQDCASEEGSFVCRALVLDDEFLRQLRDSLSPEEYSRYFGRIQNSKFCAPAE